MNRPALNRRGIASQHDAHWQIVELDGQADFLIGYLDRIENRIILAGLREIRFPEDAPDSFEVVDAEGKRHRVPFHRVKEVYRNGERIWRRTHRKGRSLTDDRHRSFGNAIRGQELRLADAKHGGNLPSKVQHRFPLLVKKPPCETQ